MQYPRPKVKDIDTGKECEVISFDEFRERKGMLNTSNSSIAYQFKSGHLDYVTIGNVRSIVWNKKAKDFSLMTRRPRTVSAVD